MDNGMDEITPKVDVAALGRLFDIRDKVAFIPGGYGGIGECIAWGLALAGAKVVVAGRSHAKAKLLAEELRTKDADAAGFAMDARSVPEIKDAVDFVVEQYGAIDILINCVGIQLEEPLEQVTEEAFDEVYAVNLRAAMFLGQATARQQIKARAGGKQIHLLSVRSQLGLRGRGYSSYCATKGALVMLVKQHAMELAPHSITVNGIAPTFVYTEMIRHVMENHEFRSELLSRIPLNRIAEPRDIVGPALLFSSPASDFITGQILYIDGGITASQ